MKTFCRVILLTFILFSLFVAASGSVHAAPLKENVSPKLSKPKVFSPPPCTPKNKGQKYNLPVPGGPSYLIQCQCFTITIENGGSTTECRWVYIGGGPYQKTWINLNSDLYMDVEGLSTSSGARIHQWTYTGANNQWWFSQDSGYGDGSVNMLSLNSSLCLGVTGSSISQGASIVLWGCNSHTDQSWFWAWNGYITGDGWPIFNAINWNSGMCLGITGASTQVGAYAVQWGCNSSYDQAWY